MSRVVAAPSITLAGLTGSAFAQNPEQEREKVEG
jgi:hypothetical protein